MIANDVMQSSRSNNFVCLCLGALIMMAHGIQLSHGYNHYNVESNEISSDFADWKALPKDEHLPQCLAKSICASLQTNAKGIQTTPLCRCRRPQRCPIHWDSFDGHSITQGSEQYKFCEPAPRLDFCGPQDTAYISVMSYSKATHELVTSTDKILCRCPEMHNYEASGHSYNELEGELDIFEAQYVCRKMPICKPAEACKAVSESNDSYLVNPKCVCPENLYCPTVTNNKMEGMPMGKGRVDFIPCQEIN